MRSLPPGEHLAQEPVTIRLSIRQREERETAELITQGASYVDCNFCSQNAKNATMRHKMPDQTRILRHRKPQQFASPEVILRVANRANRLVRADLGS